MVDIDQGKTAQSSWIQISSFASQLNMACLLSDGIHVAGGRLVTGDGSMIKVTIAQVRT